ncbi:MAG: cupin domain-containing protein, partial [Candidatus Obscuribacterales bacterium]|nr:cupin domain-containing protein [Candidatus Obscuribacterales bacterium]
MNTKTESELQKDVQYFEYTKAANPLAQGSISQVPFAELLSHLHEQGATRIIPFDLADKLSCGGPASSPNLSAAFIRIEPGEQICTSANATSELYYVIRGKGVTTRNELSMEWKAGDFFVLPCGSELIHSAETDSALYWITDEPLLRYLGVSATEKRFSPTLYKAEDCES